MKNSESGQRGKRFEDERINQRLARNVEGQTIGGINSGHRTKFPKVTMWSQGGTAQGDMHKELSTSAKESTQMSQFPIEAG